MPSTARRNDSAFEHSLAPFDLSTVFPGDLVFNSDPTTGGPIGWVNVTAICSALHGYTDFGAALCAAAIGHFNLDDVGPFG